MSGPGLAVEAAGLHKACGPAASSTGSIARGRCSGVATVFVVLAGATIKGEVA